MAGVTIDTLPVIAVINGCLTSLGAFQAQDLAAQPKSNKFDFGIRLTSLWQVLLGRG